MSLRSQHSSSLLSSLWLLCFVIFATTSNAETDQASTKTTDSGLLKAFESDGCSAFPDGTPAQQQLWLSCCVAHDLSYWQGGTYQQRLDADQQLQTCVANVGHPKIAQLMLAGVRVGGTPYLPTHFRWAYGWPYLRAYQTLTSEEQEQVRLHLLQYQQLHVPKSQDQHTSEIPHPP